MTYSFEGQSPEDIDTKFDINKSPTLEKNAIFPKYVKFQFLHFNARHGKSIAVLDKISVPGKDCQDLICTVQCMNCQEKSVGFSIFRLISMGNKVDFC